MFLHGGIWHLLGNMWSLYIFGDNVEDRLGPFRYLLFYLLCGWASGLFHLFLNWQSPVPTIGASGAIAGVMGAYLILFPHSRILTLIPILFIPYFIEIPAYFFLGLWFLFQFLGAAGSGAQAEALPGGLTWAVSLPGLSWSRSWSEFLKPGCLEKCAKPRRKQGPRGSRWRLSMMLRRTSSLRDDWGLPKRGLLGTRKLISVKWGMRSRILRVTVPPRLREGTVLRLVGLGKMLPDGKKGDFAPEGADQG